MKSVTLLLLMSLLLLAGCRPYHGWLSDVFYQGKKANAELEIIRQHFRSRHVYDQFSTIGHFDTMWLSDEVRRAYAAVYARKFGLGVHEHEVLLEQELEKNRSTISFYVLTALPSCYKKMLHEPDPEWSIRLEAKTGVHRPRSIEPVDLSPEYVLFFGHAHTRFKTAYLVQFDAKSPTGKQVIGQQTQEIRLVVARTDRRAELRWCLDENGRVIRGNLVKLTNTLQYDIQCCP